jgi:hypothetical protein
MKEFYTNNRANSPNSDIELNKNYYLTKLKEVFRK